jgi:hypothetical protein
MALAPGQNDLLTSNERWHLLYESQTVPRFCFLMGILGLGCRRSLTNAPFFVYFGGLLKQIYMWKFEDV